MTIPGIGAITSVAFICRRRPEAIRQVAKRRKYFGLTNRRDQSGEPDVAAEFPPEAISWSRLSVRGSNITSDANEIVVGPEIMGVADSQA